MPDNLEILDFSNHPNPQIAVESWVDKQRARLLDMETCLYDSALLCVSEQHYIWYFNQHHLITDVTSVRLIYDRMSAFYGQALAGETPNLPSLPDYQDYVAHENQVKSEENFKRASAFWQEQLDQAFEPVTFYREGNHDETTRTERHYLSLSEHRLNRLRELAEQPGIRSFSMDLTYANLFGALVLAFMHRMSGNEQLRLGAPFANRTTSAFRETIGLFIEVLSIAVTFDPDETFATLVKKVAARQI